MAMFICESAESEFVLFQSQEVDFYENKKKKKRKQKKII